jgi:hypothetical protein
MILVGVCVYYQQNAFGSIGGTVGSLIPCGSGGTLYTNLTPSAMSFDLSLTNLEGGGGCSVTASWTDASGNAQTITASPSLPVVVATSLGSNGAVVWSSSAGGGGPLFQWQLEQPSAVSIGGPLAATQCGSTGTLYSNLTQGRLAIHLGIADASNCEVTLSWVDAGGHARTLAVGDTLSEGVSTSLPAGGAISYSSVSGTENISATWQIERTPAYSAQ